MKRRILGNCGKEETNTWQLRKRRDEYLATAEKKRRILGNCGTEETNTSGNCSDDEYLRHYKGCVYWRNDDEYLGYKHDYLNNCSDE